MNELEEKEFLNSLKNKKYFEEWFQIVKPYLLSEEFQKRKMFKHHVASVYEHSCVVSYKCFVYAKKKKLNERNYALAGLLHDFYPYTWRYSPELDNIDKKYNERVKNKDSRVSIHGIIHGDEAYENLLKFFPELESVEIKDAITRHMFPLTRMPRTRLGWKLTMVDKIDSVVDIVFMGIIKK